MFCGMLETHVISHDAPPVISEIQFRDKQCQKISLQIHPKETVELNGSLNREDLVAQDSRGVNYLVYQT